MATRSAPDGGYVSQEKDLYRRQIWNIAKHTARKSQCLLMPSIEGFEIETAVAKGIPSAQLHVVDDNPAIVATLKRKWPRIHTYGVSADRACERIAQNGVRLGFANLDFCCQLALSTAHELHSIGTSDCWLRESMIAVTGLRGRESESITFCLDFAASITTGLHQHLEPCLGVVGDKGLSLRDRARIFLIAGFLGAVPLKSGIYLSTNGQTFLWTVYRRSGPPHPDICDNFLRFIQTYENEKSAMPWLALGGGKSRFRTLMAERLAEMQREK